MSSLVNGGSPTTIVGLRIAKFLQLHVEDSWFEKKKKPPPHKEAALLLYRTNSKY